MHLPWQEPGSLFESGGSKNITEMPDGRKILEAEPFQPKRNKEGIQMISLTENLVKFQNAEIKDDCLSAESNTMLPYPSDRHIRKIIVRRCYVDVFDLILNSIAQYQKKSFGISGTPGIGKSLFFNYMIYQFIHDFSCSFKPKNIVYQLDVKFYLFDLQFKIVSVFSYESFDQNILENLETVYIVDGSNSNPIASACVTLFISSPRSKYCKNFVTHTSAEEWFFPVWSEDEINLCHKNCYPNFSSDSIQERYRIYGGMARYDMSFTRITKPFQRKWRLF